MSKYKFIELKFDQAQQPKFTENRAKGFVEFGLLNNYPEYILSLYNESPKHGAIVRGKAGYILGKGFADDAGKLKANEQGETWNEIAEKAILDDEIHAGYYLQIVYNKLGKIASVFHIPFKNCRISVCGAKIYVKKDWNDNKEKVREYPVFDPSTPNETQIFVYKQYNPQAQYYPIPGYQQALNYIESDVQIGRHILGNANQGFVGSTLINLNNGNPPDEDAKEEIEKAVLKKFTGADGRRTVIMFNNSKENSADIVPLGQSILTKEDFTNINNLVQQEIFAGHQITSPSLFGIKTEGQLGGRNEIREAYEIFNNTYVAKRQMIHDMNFTWLKSYTSQPIEMVIVPVEPLGFEFSEAIISQNLSKDEIRELMGKEPLDQSIKTQAQVISDNINALSPLVANKVLESMTADEIRSLAGLIPSTGVTDGSMPPPTPETETQLNSSLVNITGRQQQQLMRIVRLFSQGKLTKQQAAIQLQAFGFTDDQINQYLGLDDDPTTDDLKFSSEAEDEVLLAEFAACGCDVNDYEVVHSEPATEAMYFAEQVDLTQLQANVMDLISKDKRITPDVLADVLGVELRSVNAVLKAIEKAGLISVSTQQEGADTIIVRELVQPLSKITDQKPSVTQVLVRYSYEGPEDDRNRPFCARLLELNKIYSRVDIENISKRLGYSVWDRRGGWFTLPNGEHRPFCRHTWKANIVIRKK
jgi:DNA-binding MarR family transcriptional regulator